MNLSTKQKQIYHILCRLHEINNECGLLSAKGGLMMGTKKVGAFSSPLKKANVIIT
jgi:hypothetical protein